MDKTKQMLYKKAVVLNQKIEKNKEMIKKNQADTEREHKEKFKNFNEKINVMSLEIGELQE